MAAMNESPAPTGSTTAVQRLATRTSAVRVNAIAPGAIDTPALAMVTDDASLTQALVDNTPMRRIGTTADIAAAALYLASDAASYVTGRVLAVDGGIETPNLPLGMPDLDASESDAPEPEPK